jgi:hypothetical protein
MTNPSNPSMCPLAKPKKDKPQHFWKKKERKKKGGRSKGGKRKEEEKEDEKGKRIFQQSFP